MTPLEVYGDEVSSAIISRDGRPLLIGSTEQAATVVQQAFLTARKRVRILCHKLNPLCYGVESVRNAAQFFLAKCDHRAEFLIESSLWDPASAYDWFKHPFILDLENFLRTDEEDQNRPGLYVKFVPLGWAKTYTCNFLLLDDYGYRLEADRESPAAIAAFFSEDAVLRDQPLKNLAEMFDGLWGVSTPFRAVETADRSDLSNLVDLLVHKMSTPLRVVETADRPDVSNLVDLLVYKMKK